MTPEEFDWLDISKSPSPSDSPEEKKGHVFQKGDKIGDFEILKELGAGGMGVIYQAYEHSLKRIVALKILHPNISNSPAAAKRFRREAILAANLNHPNIVPVYHIDEHPNPRYFTMEYVPGRSLMDKIKKSGFLPPTQAITILLQTCDALQYAHDQNIIHRDIKPGNILLQNHLERVRITDFGIAQDTTGQLVEYTTAENVSSGTLGFMSPEQNLGQKLDQRSDIFSLGVTFYFMLTGQLPFQTQNRAELALAFEKIKPTLPSQINPDAPPELDRVILKMIAVAPKNRYDSCSAVTADLKKIQPSPTQIARISYIGSRLKKIPPRPDLWIFAAIILLVIGLAMWLGIPYLIQGKLIPGRGWQVKSLVSNPGNQTNPLWSPDGEQIAYMSDESGSWQLYIMDSDGSHKWQLTGGPHESASLSWSPDSKSVVYAQGDKHPTDLFLCRLTPDRRGVVNRWNLTNAPSDTEYNLLWGPAVFSPDGKWIVAHRMYNGWPKLHVIANRNSEANESDWNLLGSQLPDESMSEFPVWKPDSSLIAYAYCDDYQGTNPSDIRTAEPNGAHDLLLVHRLEIKERIRALAWSPDGRYIAFSFNFGGIDKYQTHPRRLGLVRSDGSIFNYDKPVLWLDSTVSGTAPQHYSWMADVWSPDGDSVVYCYLDNDNWSVWLIDRTSENKRLVVSSTKGDNINPRFSQNDAILFQNNHKGNWDIFLAYQETR